MKFRSTICRYVVAGLLASGLLASLSSTAHAQATYTATRLSELSVFGGYTYTTPDYSYYKDNGGAFGVDLARYNRSRYTPALEVRADFNSGPVISEDTYMGGLRVHTDFHQRYHPYVDFLVGIGKVTYPVQRYLPAPTVVTIHDQGLAYSYGGGMNIDITPSFMLKLDGQQQSINLGPNSEVAPQDSTFSLAPVVLTVGVTYRVSFHKWTSHGHEAQ
jgi:hypothetical protein